MKRRSILEKQSVKRKGPKDLSRFWKVIRLVTSLSFKLSLLLAGMISVSLLFLYLYQYLITSPYMRLERVIVTGVKGEIKSELIELSELSTDLSMLAIDSNKKKEAMERHPWVRSVELEKRFPHTLVIRAEKEVPRALVAFDNLSYMNRYGEIFKEVEKADNKNYPVITGILKKGSNRDELLMLASRVLDLFESETGAWSYNELSEIHINKDGNIAIYSVSLPAVIKMGSRELDIKKDELKKIVKHLKKTGRINMVKVIDLNYRYGAVVSFKKG
ncbi:cell division protein FtsQ/DivIB [Thermodesulfobacteriota bacterium]